MSEQKHTPEPYSLVLGSQHLPYTEIIHGSTLVARVVRLADARRIQSCVNAMAGVADPAAELARLRGIEKVYAAAVEECRVKRQSPNISKPGPHFKQEFAHDTARADAGMGVIK